ncbi:hypothetical protein B0W47_16610 (plasmid) [Komagataeibacter nataicola]|uniref:Uncharacterized protein n=1 Tax=Komagataeibacter nataicola TaxID=265960 RepID=A0A9N7CCJ0_9PROT|nr:hypothetical protein [Komagataeibacter nataicola]AQU89203.1 hypothetical protein B0W47_16610 [Komagataeibacter nataicola]PYD66283.1 hypothetical protein CDI09_09040 [Komagataeibacter nataicola]WNM10311.1 hypothetical protein RI056_18600 [Komagataeibacter nataicola]GBR23368.1 hypothetical protein AA0616_2504 [Komagataeibacter nataicola NRIC 0616]
MEKINLEKIQRVRERIQSVRGNSKHFEVMVERLRANDKPRVVSLRELLTYPDISFEVTALRESGISWDTIAQHYSESFGIKIGIQTFRVYYSRGLRVIREKEETSNTVAKPKKISKRQKATPKPIENTPVPSVNVDNVDTETGGLAKDVLNPVVDESPVADVDAKVVADAVLTGDGVSSVEVEGDSVDAGEVVESGEREVTPDEVTAEDKKVTYQPKAGEIVKGNRPARFDRRRL